MDYYMKRAAERRRLATDTVDFTRFVWASIKYPTTAGGYRDAMGMSRELRNFGSVRLDGWLERKSAVHAVTAGTAGEGAEWADLSGMATEWLNTVSAKTFLGRLLYRRIPFATRVLNTASPTARFIGPGAGIVPAQPSFGDSTQLLRTKVSTLAIFTNESARVWGPGTRENLDAVLTRSLVRGIDLAALDPASAAVADERPASLLNGVAAIGLLGTTVSAVLGNVKSMIQALVDGGSDLESALFVLHPRDAATLSTLITTEGVLAFPQLGALGGSILGIPAVTSVGAVSSGSPSERVFALVDGEQIAVADDNGIEVYTSDRVSIHMDDATTQDARDGTGTQLVSMFQTESTAVKLNRVINWARLTDSAVAWCTVAA